MRVLDPKNDASLALALVASTVVIFQQPLRLVIDSARELELRYHLDLIPGLTLLVAAFAFHQYRKRQQARAAVRAAEAEAAHERTRAAELERLVALGHSLGSALEPTAVRQVFWRFLPAFAGEREFWMLTTKPSGWDTFIRDATVSSQRSTEVLEAIAAKAITMSEQGEAPGTGVLVDDDVCFAMVVNENVLGVVGLRNQPPLASGERRALEAAVSLLAIAIRNVQLLAYTRENSVRDHLTGCFNHSYALETLPNELKRAKRSGQPLAVIMFDIDQFKAVNDRYGHLAGDALLAAVADYARLKLRTTDIKCRYGGDEFLVILPETTLQGAEHAAESLTREIGTLQLTTERGMLSPTISVGVAAADNDELDALTLIARADAALYHAKQTGRNRYSVSPSDPKFIATATVSA